MSTEECPYCFALTNHLADHLAYHPEVRRPWDFEPGLKIDAVRGAFLLGVIMRDREGFVGTSDWHVDNPVTYRAAWDNLLAAREKGKSNE